MSIVLARAVREETDFATLLEDRSRLAEVSEEVRGGTVLIVRKAVDPDFLRRLRSYLRGVVRGSLPNYQAIVPAAPNFHRVYGDPRSYVKGRFHQFSFFPWNQDVFGLFDRLRPVYVLNNRINGKRDDQYLGLQPELGCTARLTVQAYPKGVGHIKQHTDAVGPHKFTTVSCCMSVKGRDYQDGGLVLRTSEDGDTMNMDEHLELGDLVWINSHVAHGVETIDPGVKSDWLDLEGKWTLICAVNKLEGQDQVENSAQIDD